MSLQKKSHSNGYFLSNTVRKSDMLTQNKKPYMLAIKTLKNIYNYVSDKKNHRS